MSTDTNLHRLVDAVMHSPVVAIDRNARLRSAAVALRDADVGTLVVMDGSTIDGVLSERDLVHVLAEGGDPDEIRVANAMSATPRYLTCGEDVASAVEVMLSAGIRHLPVLEEGELVGIVSMRDLVGALRP